MTDLRTAAQQALEVLEDWDSPVALPAITALRSALAQEQAEPVRRTMTLKELIASIRGGEKWQVVEPLKTDGEKE